LRSRGNEILSEQQKIGLKHYDDFLTKIPRNEVRRIEETVVTEVHRLLPRATALACGSYRRGKDKSGDCDILITDPEEEECGILPQLLENLHKSGFLTDDLTHVYGHKMGRCDSYMGVCRLESHLPYRRLDIKVYPRRFFGFALLYFTGSDHFNRSMRLFARKKGWSLSDRSLTRVIRHNGMKVEQGESVACYSEVDVFIAIKILWNEIVLTFAFSMKMNKMRNMGVKLRTWRQVWTNFKIFLLY
jgi:DNA polymerase lambda